MSSNQADSQHERLWAIAGQWDTTGHVIGDTPVPVSGSDVYEVLPGGYFLLHHVDVTVGSQAAPRPAVASGGHSGVRYRTRRTARCCPARTRTPVPRRRSRRALGATAA